MRRIAVAFLFALSLTSPVFAQNSAVTPADSVNGAYVGPNPASIGSDVPAGALAVTVCFDNGGTEEAYPVTHYRADVVLDQATAAQLAAHEAVHRAQLSGDCNAQFAAVIATAQSLLAAEVPAYCAQIAEAKVDFPGSDDLPYFQKTVMMLSRYLSAAYPKDTITAADVSHALFQQCRPDSVTYPDGN